MGDKNTSSELPADSVAKHIVPGTPPALVAVREEGNVLTIEGFPGWLPWKIGLRLVATIGITFWVVAYMSGVPRWVFGFGAATLWVALAFLVRKTATRTTLKIGPRGVKVDTRGSLFSRRLEAPIKEFAIRGILSLYAGRGDLLPIFYLGCTFGDQREEVFVGYPWTTLVWIRDQVELRRHGVADPHNPALNPPGLRPAG